MSSVAKSNEQEQNYRAFLEILYKYRHLGMKSFPDGSIAIGHVPHVASLAYFHRLFSPLNEFEIEALQDEMECDFPNSLVSFFLLHNGLGVFSDNLNVYGQRRNWQRHDVEAAAQQPFSIQSGNVDKWPQMAPVGSLVIGSLGPERSPITVDKDGQVFLWPQVDSPSPSRSYSDVFAFLLVEAQRLSAMFDEAGRSIDIQYH